MPAGATPYVLTLSPLPKMQYYISYFAIFSRIEVSAWMFFIR